MNPSDAFPVQHISIRNIEFTDCVESTMMFLCSYMKDPPPEIQHFLDLPCSSRRRQEWAEFLHDAPIAFQFKYRTRRAEIIACPENFLRFFSHFFKVHLFCLNDLALMFQSSARFKLEQFMKHNTHSQHIHIYMNGVRCLEWVITQHFCPECGLRITGHSEVYPPHMGNPSNISKCFCRPRLILPDL
jgi:hypothetical protein